MHEMGIAAQVVEIAIASIPKEMTDVKVETVYLKIGRLSSVVPESLRFCFDVIIQDTPLCNAKLVIKEIPVTARCNDCNREWVIVSPAFRCSRCDSGNIRILSGQELEIESIEIEES